MSLDSNQPTDRVPVSELPAWIRASRAAINTVTAGTGLAVNNLGVALGTTSLSIGTDLAAVGHEIVIITGLAAVTLATILGGTDGQIKTFVFQDGNIDFTDDTKADGQFFLNQVALTDFNAALDDVLCLVNIGGDGGVSDHGYWKELYRTIDVK